MQPPKRAEHQTTCKVLGHQYKLFGGCLADTHFMCSRWPQQQSSSCRMPISADGSSPTCGCIDLCAAVDLSSQWLAGQLTLSRAFTLTMPLASMSKVTSIWGMPRGAGGMPTCTAGYTALSPAMLTAWRYPCSFSLHIILPTMQLQLAQAKQQPAGPGTADSIATSKT